MNVTIFIENAACLTPNITLLRFSACNFFLIQVQLRQFLTRVQVKRLLDAPVLSNMTKILGLVFRKLHEMFEAAISRHLSRILVSLRMRLQNQ